MEIDKPTITDFTLMNHTHEDAAQGGTITNITGNAETVTDGVYTTGSYADPDWIASLDGTKITGQITSGISGGTF